jgi:hypothetical protein
MIRSEWLGFFFFFFFFSFDLFRLDFLGGNAGVGEEDEGEGTGFKAVE